MPANETIVCSTPDEIAHFRLASLKYQLRAEAAGFKNSTGRALRPQLAEEFGLSPRAPHADYIKVIQDKMDIMVAARHNPQP